MVEYRINYWNPCFTFKEKTNEIHIASTDMSMLSDSELSDYISDSFTHEYIHKVLYDMFDITTCKLFDGIQQYFRNTSLQETIFGNKENTGRECYHKFIERVGFKGFLEYYHIDNDNFNQAFILCSSR